MELDGYSIILIKYIAENIIKILLGSSIFIAIIKSLLIVRYNKFANYFILIIYKKRFSKHIFYRNSEKIKSKILFNEINVNHDRIDLARNILLVEYNMLFNYTSEMIEHFLKPKKNVSIFNIINRYESDPEVIRSYLVKNLNLMRLASIKGLEVYEIPDKVIKKYSIYRNIIYDSIDQIIYVLCSEYKFAPLIIWGFLNANYVLYTQMKTFITYFINSLNGEINDDKVYRTPDHIKEIIDKYRIDHENN